MLIRVYFIFTAMVVMLPVIVSAQWNPNAGVIPPFTVAATVITSSSGSPNSENVIDQNDQTHWQSSASLPSNYIGRSDQNVFWAKPAWFSGSEGTPNYALLTDGNTNNVVTVTGNLNQSVLKIIPDAPLVHPVCMNVKMNLGSGVTAKIYAYSSATDSVLLGTYTAANNYSNPRYNFPDGMTVAFIRVVANSNSIQVFEVGCLGAPPKEFVVVDLGAVKSVGYIETRHWAGGNATATVLYASEDGMSWQLVDSLDPQTLPKVPLQLAQNINVRYIKLEHTLNTTDYAKCLIWEITAYDENGWMGTKPAPQKSKQTLGAMLGVNSLWGWGHNTYSSPTDNGKGPWLFRKAISQGRMYHNLNWDVTDPDGTPDFAAMAAGEGTPAHFWLNWDTEYRAWKNAGLETETSIQFTASDFPPGVWNDPYQAAYNYGAAFAEHFGAPSGNHFVKTLEIGNEPWDYQADFYRNILRGMAAGAKAADPEMVVLPGALQAAFPGAENGQFKNFTGVRLTEAEAPYLDGLNSHLYCFRNDQNGIRRNIFPEAPFSEFWTILADIRFRDKNMPGKKIYVTEFGWDSPGGGDNCDHNECVTEKAQAIYGVRAALLLTRLGIDRFHWYFYGDQYAGTLFARSGMHSLDFTLKRRFLAFQSLKTLLGDKYFLGVEKEDNEAYIYKFGNADSTVTHYVAWRPVDSDLDGITTVAFDSPKAPMAAWTIAGLDTAGEKLDLPFFQNGQIHLPISATPTVVQVEPGAALPVELLHFSGKKADTGNALKWTIAPGQHWRSVTLERSANGVQFSPIFTQGYQDKTQFLYTDEQVPPGLLYYRLQFTDDQNQPDFSPIIVLRSEVLDAFIYPNPVRDLVYLKNVAPGTPYRLVSNIGRVVQQGETDNGVLDCRDLPGGMYYLVVGDRSGPLLKM